MTLLLIPKAVVDYWEPKFDDLRRHGVSQEGDAFYAKVLEAKKFTNVVVVRVVLSDLQEIEREIASALDDETDVSIGRDPEDRRIKEAFLSLRKATARAVGKCATVSGAAPLIKRSTVRVTPLHTIGSAGSTTAEDTNHVLLDHYVRARNGLRSAEVAAEGFVSGIRIRNLTACQTAMRKALLDLDAWVEAQARVVLDLQPTPVKGVPRR